MAGDWIKMRASLQTHPKVVRIASALCTDKFRVVGALHAVWCLFDAHTEDGKLDGFSDNDLDQLIGWPGFSAEMARIGWMTITPESLVLSEFSTHNGSSAKRRAQEADRKRNVRKSSASSADKKRTREEKRREEKKKIKPMSGQPDVGPAPPLDFDSPEGLIAYLNVRAGKHFEPVDANLRLLRGRMSEGATADQVRAVIDRQVREWSGTDMAKYLRPATLFNAEKFAQYAGELSSAGGAPRDWWLAAGYGSEEAALREGVRRAA